MDSQGEEKKPSAGSLDLLRGSGRLIGRGWGLASDTVKRRHLVPKSILVGVLAGLFGVALRAGSKHILQRRLEMASAFGEYAWIPGALAGAMLGFVAVWLVRRFCIEAGGGGIAHLRHVVANDAPMRWPRLLVTKMLSLLGVTCAGMGGGPDATAMHIGGAVGKGVAVSLRVKQGEGEHRALIAAGAAAGLSSAFNAPLSGLVFALEELQGNFDSKLLVSALLSSVSADIVSRQFLGPYPVFENMLTVQAADSHALPFAVLLGLVAGILGVCINRSVQRAQRAYESQRSDRRRMLFGAFVGLVTGGLSLSAIPGISGISGGGAELVAFSFAEHPSFLLIGGLFFARLLSTLAFTRTGASGGFLISILAMGALAGRALGDLVALRFPEWVPNPEVLAVVGMGAFFSASIRAPLTGLVLMLELTGNYSFMLPTLIACLTAHIVAEETGEPPVYRATSTDASA